MSIEWIQYNERVVGQNHPTLTDTINRPLRGFLLALGVDPEADTFDFLTQAVADLLYAPLASPAFTGTPTAPTAAPGTNNTQLATTEYVDLAVAGAAAGGDLDDLDDVDTSGVANGDVLGFDSGDSTWKPVQRLSQAQADALYSALGHTHAFASLTSIPTTLAGYGITDAYTKAVIDAALALLAPLASPALTGNPTAPTQAPGDNSTKIATTAYVEAAVAAGGGGGGGGNSKYPHAGTTDLEIWYSPLHAVGDRTISNFNSANIRAVPFVAPGRGGTLDRIAIEITSIAAANNMRLGLYNSKGSGNIYPDELIVDSGDLSTGSLGQVAHTISEALVAGEVYWLALISSATIGVRALASASQDRTILGGLGTGQHSHLVSAQAFGALPDPFPAGATKTAGTCPSFEIRFSA